MVGGREDGELEQGGCCPGCVEELCCGPSLMAVSVGVLG